ncbi:MAG: AAA family ATPase, partial [Chloroflexi bacterium]|nr:AAA family ATPase [Chloroflexota bacterium]
MSYIVGHPIKHPADFYGRHEQVTRFFEIIGGTQAQSVSVLGVRRAGKTSFLQFVAHPTIISRYLPNADNCLMVYIDVSSCKSPSDFYYRLLQRLKVSLGKAKTNFLWKESPLGQTNLYDIESYLCQFPKQRIILLLDEFDHLQTGAFTHDFLTELRAMTSVLEYDLACVTASYWDLYTLGTRLGLPPTSPFYNIFYPTPIYMSALELAEATLLIDTPA